MKQLTISFTDPQFKHIQERAKELGISVADMVRRIVDEWRERKG